MIAKASGYFAFVLHSHIPYVLSHGRWPHGSDWLLEVTAESYIPLLDALYDLVEEGCSPKITVGITPVLAEQLADESFKPEFAAYVRQKAKAAVEDRKAFSRLKDEPCLRLAEFWHDHYSGVLNRFRKRYDGSLPRAFAALQDQGHIEIITSSATHGYFPLLAQDVSIQAQVKQGVTTYVRHFGCQPVGFWLPECAYRPSYRWSPPLQPKGRHIEPYDRKGVEEFLEENRLKYFIVGSHLLEGGETRGVYVDRFGALQTLWAQQAEEQGDEAAPKTLYSPYLVDAEKRTCQPGISAFVRDETTGSQVWSRQHGYPGDVWYLEFHKKHSPGGLRYSRITGPEADLGDKEVYDPGRAEARIHDHAAHFIRLAEEILCQHSQQTGEPGIICAPYDTELFGHWWFEGTRWFREVLKGMQASAVIELTTCGEFLEKHPPSAAISLPEGSWGEGGFHYMWLNEETDWSWSYIYDAELEMQELASKYGTNEEVLPILKQAARELLLLQSSDWQFSISTQTSKEYAEVRLTEHYKSFQRLVELVRTKASGQPVDEDDWNFFKICEERDCLFPDIDPMWFAELEQT